MVRHVKSMGASTAGVSNFKSILYSQNLVLARIFRAYFPFCRIFYPLIQVFLAFQRLLLLEYGGGPEKDRNVCFWWWDSTLALPGFVLPAGYPLA